MNISHYAKAIVYIAVSVVTVLVTAVADNVISVEELVNLGIIMVGAIGVYWAPNVPGTALAYFKGAVAFTTGALVLLASVLLGGITLSEWMQVILAGFAAIGVVTVPNEVARKPYTSTN